MGIVMPLPLGEWPMVPAYREGKQVAHTPGVALESESADSLSNAGTPPLPGNGSAGQDEQGISREVLRAYMVTHSKKGSKIMPKRSKKSSGKPELFKSPHDPKTEFRIKHVGTREMVEARDDSAIVRYVTRDTGNGVEYISEKEFPEGTRQLQTIVRCLASWNILDEDGNPVAIDEDNVMEYIDAEEEFDALYDKCVEVNPCLLGVNARKSRLKSDPPTPGGSADGEDDAPAIRDDVSPELLPTV
jgi:hypothetical protein